MDVAIVGAGLAGLSCAVRLESAGISIKLLEAEDAPGGRLRTDQVDGFRLDRGFQVLLTAYPELPYHFDTKALRLRPFVNGALVRHARRFHRFVDPFRSSLGDAMSTALDPLVTFGDKLRVARLRAAVRKAEPSSLFRKTETTTRQFLEEYGFSSKMIDRFFTPFYAGIFLDRELVTSSRWFEFLFHMFAYGNVAVPENGMEMLPRQLAVRLHSETLETKVCISGVRRDGDRFILEAGKGRSYQARQVVLATDQARARSLIGTLVGRSRFGREAVQWNRTTTFYYAAERSPVDGPILVLNGDGPNAGPVNNAVVISQASERYAPPGAHLVAASVVGRAPQSERQMEQLERETREHLQRWFGQDVVRWAVVGGYPIVQALPLCRHVDWQQNSPRVGDGVYLCGDYRENPSTQGALASGRRAADAVLSQTS
ncbi:MAG: oxidoreductase, FAD-binding [Acidobacteriaceae bacterium]|nr:oxidoreductase, FAD-binding [Acidobacteriaceae bacterium]